MAIEKMMAYPVQAIARHNEFYVLLLSDGKVRFHKDKENSIDVSQESSIFKEFVTIKDVDKFVEFMENILTVYQISEV